MTIVVDHSVASQPMPAEDREPDAASAVDARAAGTLIDDMAALVRVMFGVADAPGSAGPLTEAGPPAGAAEHAPVDLEHSSPGAAPEPTPVDPAHESHGATRPALPPVPVPSAPAAIPLGDAVPVPGHEPGRPTPEDVVSDPGAPEAPESVGGTPQALPVPQAIPLPDAPTEIAVPELQTPPAEARDPQQHDVAGRPHGPRTLKMLHEVAFLDD